MEETAKFTTPEALGEYEKLLCPSCKDMICKEMLQLAELNNSTSRLDRAKAKAKTAHLTMTLWKRLCSPCLEAIKKSMRRQ